MGWILVALPLLAILGLIALDVVRRAYRHRLPREVLTGLVQGHFLELRLPATAITEPVASAALRLQFIYSLAGLVLGLAFALLGVVLLVHGVTGSAGWVVQLLGLKSSLSDAAPGVVLVVAGVLVVFLTRFEVRAEK